MPLVAKANKIIDFSYIAKLPNLCFCLPEQTKSLICLTLASSKIYAFACQGKQIQRLFLHRQALRSMLLLATANKIIEFAYIGKLSNLCFRLPRQTKSRILLTLASYQIYAFACHGKQNHGFFLHWQALESMLLLPGQTKSLIFRTLASSQIYASACHGKQNP